MCRLHELTAFIEGDDKGKIIVELPAFGIATRLRAGSLLAACHGLKASDLRVSLEHFEAHAN
ncbi:hypothetical protein [Cupriavidus basilensis]|uniref:hypothetical protein n=1 Tax=Cupriavidus basilensis TaxID=68895 RepID=UPI0005BBE644|nr:hypothetical protein [Cupriavidus basilensis]